MRWIGSGLVLAFVALLALHVTSDPGSSIISKTFAAKQQLVLDDQASCYVFQADAACHAESLWRLLPSSAPKSQSLHLQASSMPDESAPSERASVLTGLLQTSR